MSLEKIFYFVLGTIIKAASERTFDFLGKKTYESIEKRNIKEKDLEKEIEEMEEDIYDKIKRYILDSFGGYENIVYGGECKNGYKIIFFDVNKVNYEHFKNANYRVFISKKQDSMVLLPKENGVEASYYC